MSSHKIQQSLENGKLASEIVKEMPRLRKKKNVVVAGVLGFLFGAIGIGIYFESFTDFLVCMGLFIGLTIISGGVLIVPAWLFAPAYGIYRAYTSNEKH
jgi:purine-cytosine permease-like protein